MLPYGSKPNKSVAINQHSNVGYIHKVNRILKPEEFKRIRETFMGHVIKLIERHLQLLGKIIYVFLTRNIMTAMENEVEFHFGAQPLRFSIRELYMITGLKCTTEGEGQQEKTENQKYDSDLLEGSHTLDQLDEQLSNTREESFDERFSIAMLLLNESILP